jgi:hypothetical protein
MNSQSAHRRGLVGPTSFAPLTPLSRCLLATGFALIALLAASPSRLPAQSLYGSQESMLRQNLVAQQHGYAYLRTPQEVLEAIRNGDLVPVEGNEDLVLAGDRVSFPVARPQVKSFLQQLAQAYHAACGEPLVVTSLTRPISRQPWNASPISVHPTGMALDLRRSDRRACLQWLESTLLALEGEGMIEATREHWPPHYHVAVFPDPLLLPGPIGDPNGVVRLAALHRGIVSEPDNVVSGAARHQRGRVRLAVSRSSRTGRLRISQTVARRGQRSSPGAPATSGARIVVHRRGAGRGHAAAGGAGVTSAKHRSHSRTHSRAATTVTAR